ncbi:MAG: cell division protein FtsK [Hyphomicrobiales bacterium]|nr:cell division protein FtsK [Hyphomicrobiales bacterium]
MLVYGDPWRKIDLALWRDRAAAPLPHGPWIAQHAELTARLIETGQVLQALEDAAFERSGCVDNDNTELLPLKQHLLALSRAVIRSFDRQAASPPPPPPRMDLPAELTAREPEGYAFYALYPEAYAIAARQLGPAPGALVIGLRSIGASLAPMVAAQLGASHFHTLRPKGPVFEREIDAPGLAAALAQAPPRDVVIVDEGPGLSGSSFASVARFIGSVAPQSRISFLPGHAGGPGAEASAETKALFAAVPQCSFEFQETLRERLPGWAADITGRALAPLEDLSGGAWRARAYASEAQWPAVDTMQERLKFLLHAERGDYLLKFVGLGEIGMRKAKIAIALGEARLAPEAFGLRHGFLIERWRGDARPLHMRRDRAMIVPALARYLAFRQKHFACPGAYGADPDSLRRMVARNTGLALGDEASDAASAGVAMLAEHTHALRKVATDNRMLVHEFLLAPDGCLMKTDGADHHAGHDLIGAQDIAYDIAAASIEFALTSEETYKLCSFVENGSEHTVDQSLLAPFRIVWLAFELGRIKLAENGCAAGSDAQRLRARRIDLTEKLKHELACPAARRIGNYKVTRSFGRRK